MRRAFQEGWHHAPEPDLPYREASRRLHARSRQFFYAGLHWRVKRARIPSGKGSQHVRGKEELMARQRVARHRLRRWLKPFNPRLSYVRFCRIVIALLFSGLVIWVAVQGL
jgi:hypothetical protein